VPDDRTPNRGFCDVVIEIGLRVAPVALEAFPLVVHGSEHLGRSRVEVLVCDLLLAHHVDLPSASANSSAGTACSGVAGTHARRG